MIVVDASALLEVLLRTPAADAVESRLFDAGQTLHAPHLLDVEVAQVIRRYAASGEIDGERGRAALADLADLPLRRYPHDFLLPRVWELRANLTAYDAVYVALAETMGAPLLTRDQSLAAAPGHHARVELILEDAHGPP
ncbi:MAG: type II toxin-antitoxin system VapC family toxin [Caulobacterales bacterium]